MDLSITDSVALTEALQEVVAEVSHQDITSSPASSLFATQPTPRIVVHTVQEGSRPTITTVSLVMGRWGGNLYICIVICRAICFVVWA